MCLFLTVPSLNFILSYHIFFRFLPMPDEVGFEPANLGSALQLVGQRFDRTVHQRIYTKDYLVNLFVCQNAFEAGLLGFAKQPGQPK
jgi:hypothetical protein